MFQISQTAKFHTTQSAQSLQCSIHLRAPTAVVCRFECFSPPVTDTDGELQPTDRRTNGLMDMTSRPTNMTDRPSVRATDMSG